MDQPANHTVDEAYRRYFPLVREKCRRMLDNAEEAQDVAQDTFIRLWKSAVPLNDAGYVTAWMYRTSTRLAIDRLRERKVRDGKRGPGAERAAPQNLESRVHFKQSLAILARHVPPDELPSPAR